MTDANRNSRAARGVIDRIGGWTGLDKVATPVAGWVHRIFRNRRLKNLASGTWLGHTLHPMLTDVPIGLWSAVSLLDLGRKGHSSRAATHLVGLGVMAALPTAVTGAADWSDTHGPTQRMGLVHAAGMDVATTLQAVSWIVRRRGARRWGAALSLAALGFMLGAAYLGGHLSLRRGVGVDHTAFQEPESTWTDVIAESELSENVPVRAMAGAVPIVLVKRRGEIFALSATCTHAGGPLDEGAVTDTGCLVCPWHGSEFALADGSVHRGPASAPEPAWQVRVTDGRVGVRPDDDFDPT